MCVCMSVLCVRACAFVPVNFLLDSCMLYVCMFYGPSWSDLNQYNTIQYEQPWTFEGQLKSPELSLFHRSRIISYQWFVLKMNVAWVTDTLTTPIMGGLGKILALPSRDLTSIDQSIYLSVSLFADNYWQYHLKQVIKAAMSSRTARHNIIIIKRRD